MQINDLQATVMRYLMTTQVMPVAEAYGHVVQPNLPTVHKEANKSQVWDFGTNFFTAKIIVQRGTK